MHLRYSLWSLGNFIHIGPYYNCIIIIIIIIIIIS